MSLGKGLVTSPEQPFLADIRRYCWEPGGTHSTVGFPQEHTPVMCREFNPIGRQILCTGLGYCVCWVVIWCHHIVFSRGYLIGPYHNWPCQIWEYWFDVSGPGLHVYPGCDLVRAGRRLLVSSDTSDGDQLRVTTAARPLTNYSKYCS